MNAVILSFESFNGRDDKKDKLYLKFKLYNPAEKQVYDIFSDADFVKVPNGVIPSNDDCPAIADVDFRMRQFQDKNGFTQYRPDVREIFKIQKTDIKFDFKK